MPFERFPDHARLWLFAADRPLDPDEQAAVLDAARAFTRSWTSHARPVPAGAELLDGCVLAVTALLADDEVNAGVSGCGIDSLQRAVDALADAVGFGWVSGLDILFRDDAGRLAVLPRPAFRALAREGRVHAETPVLDLTLASLGALRAEGLERPAQASWHGRVFRLTAPA